MAADYPPILVVDDNDRPVGSATMEKIHQEGLWHRIARVMVVDENGKILLQRRSPNVLTSPNLWDHSAAGHVDAGKTYEEAALREANEEIGLTNINLVELGSWQSKSITEDGRILNRFNKAYKTTLSSPKIKKNPKEVTGVRWFSLDELKKIIAENPETMTTGLQRVIKNYF